MAINTAMTDDEFGRFIEQLLEGIVRELAPRPGEPEFEKRGAVIAFAVWAVRLQVAGMRQALENASRRPRPFRPMVPTGARLS